MDLVLASEASTSLTSYKLFLVMIGPENVFQGIDINANFVCGIGVETLRTELEDIKCLLEDAYEKSEEEELSESVKIWLKQTKEAAELVEDIVDEYFLMPPHQWNRRGLINFFARAGRSTDMLSNVRRSVASKIQNIVALLREIKKRGEKCHLRHRGSSSSSKTAIVDRYQPRLDCVVGIDSAEEELVGRLMGGGSRRLVISLVGAVGIGKTTLAKKVYDNEMVSGHFDLHAWIVVSPSYHEVLNNTAKQICDVGGFETMTSQELISTIGECLQYRRYLLVFDHIWQEEFWQVMKDALPDNDQGSRVIFTTRSETVAVSCTESSFDHVHRLEPLPEALSWDLFCRIAFQYEPVEFCPPELKQLSEKIIRMCEGWPLAIVSVAGLLSTRKKIGSEWQRIVDTFYLQLKSDPHLAIVSKILAFSFRDLPYQLKLCFLYFSIFPAGSLIPYDRLIKLWIAEGFVRLRVGKTLEEVAEEYLNELIRRNLVQACQGFYGLEKFCRVHGLMYEMAQQMADEFSFCHFLDGKNSSFRGKSRRLSVVNDIHKNVFENIKDSRVRSVFLSNIGSLSYAFLVTLFEKYKLLTLLDFENVAIDHLPEEVGNLFHLKYLSLKNTKVERLPKSVGKLKNLQTMDARNTLLVELPIEINMLENLRHLLASHGNNKNSWESTQGVRIKEGIGCLKNLLTLMTVEAHFNFIGIIKELKILRLRRLCISSLTTEVAGALCVCIEEMGHLEFLSLHSASDYEILAIQNISSAPPLLQHLTLKGRLQSFPNWISSLRNLSMLRLSLSRLTDDPLRHISVLPNLESLWLYRAYEGGKLHFEVGGFQKLKFLVLRDLEGLEVVEIEESALPLLEELRIGPSPLLTLVPSGTQHLRSLKVIAFYDMPNELVQSIQPSGSSDYWKVEHVPSILFLYRVVGRHHAIYELGASELLDRLQGLATNINDVAQHNLRFSFCYSDDEADSALASTSVAPRNDMQLSFCHNRMSFSSGRCSFFSDDIED